jgi:hypothetical protein
LGNTPFRRDPVDPLRGLSPEIEKLFDDWTGHRKFDTYLACFSEHKESEDTFGRLSMWRAYGGTTGVALVMKNEPFQSTTISDVLKIYGSPVAYFDESRHMKAFSEVVDNIESNARRVFCFGASSPNIIGS